MKKFVSLLIAVILATSTFFSTTALAVDTTKAPSNSGDGSNLPKSTFEFTGLKLLKEGIVVDVERRIIYGFDGVLTNQSIKDYIAKGDQFDDMVVTSDYIGTGSTVALINTKENLTYYFNVVVFGDVNGDGVYDVLDAMNLERLSTGKEAPTPDTPEFYAADLNKDGKIDANDYGAQVEGVLINEIDQNKGVNGKVEGEQIDDKIYTGNNIEPKDDVKLTFNNGKLSVGNDYDIVKYNYNKEIGVAEIVVEGKGLFSGQKVITFKIVDVLQDMIKTANKLLADSKLSDLVTIVDKTENGVTDIDICVDATRLMQGNINLDMAAFTNFLSRLDAYKADKLTNANVTVGQFNIMNNGVLNNTALKNWLFDFADGFFYILANTKNNVLKTYDGSVAASDKTTSNFNVEFKVTGKEADIASVKSLAGKLSRYLSFSVVNKNAVIDVKMPAAFSQQVVDLLGSGDVEAARDYFNSITVYTAFEKYLIKVRPEHISQSSAADIDKLLGVVISFEGLANKVLNHISSATIKTTDGKDLPFLNGSALSIDKTATNKFGAIVLAAAQIMSKDVLLSNVSSFCKDGKYTGEFDISLDVAGIKETVILNLDLFGDIKTPDIIKDTSDYVGSIITELGINNAVGVTYDKKAQRVVGSVNATEVLAGNFTMNDAALDGLLTNAKGFFNEKFANSDITVGSHKIVTNGSVNKPELKKFIFEFANGFFFDVGNMNSDNVIRTFATVVKEANGKEHTFDLDFQLTGNKADTDRVATLSRKIARYVSLDTTTGNATANVTLPASMTNKIVSLLGEGNPALARQTFDNLTVADVVTKYIKNIQPEHISQSSAEDIRAALKMIQGMDGFVDKVLTKVAATSKAYDTKGNSFELLSGAPFEITEPTIGGVAAAVLRVLNKDLSFNKLVSDYKNPDGTYTLRVDVDLTVGDIHETLILNMDVFGEADAPTVIEKTADYFDSIIRDLGVQSAIGVTYDPVTLKAVGSVDATAILNGGLTLNDEALNGLLTDVKGYFNQNFGTSDIIVGDYEIVTDGQINKPVLKSFLFDFAHGFFYDVGKLGLDNVLRKYAVKVCEASGHIHTFDLDFKLDGKQDDINRISSVSGKIAKYVSLDTSTGNATANVVLPASVTNKIVSLLGEGNPALARQTFDNLTVAEVVTKYIKNIQPEHISESSAADIRAILNAIQGVDGLVNKVLTKVAPTSKAYDTKGNSFALLSGAPFEITEATIGGVAAAVLRVLNKDLSFNKLVSDYKKPDGTYSLKVDVDLTVGDIHETLILNMDVFGKTDAPTEIDETVQYVDSIVTDLGINNLVAVNYDAANTRACGSINATELLNGTFNFNDAALEGLLTKTKDFFNQKFGNSDITIGGHKLVTKGSINNTELKNFLFDFAHGFFYYVGNLGVDNVVKSFKTVVVNDKNETREFNLDFLLEGDQKDIDRVTAISAKVAKYVSLDTTTTDAKLRVVLPLGVENKIVEVLGTGDINTAIDVFDNLTVADLVVKYVQHIQPEHISQTYAADIQTAINMVQKMDGFVNKVLGKVTADSKAYDINGKPYKLLSGAPFEILNPSIGEIAAAVVRVLNPELAKKKLIDYKNPDGTYTLTVDVGLTVGGIREKVFLNLDVFGLKANTNKTATLTSGGSTIKTASLPAYSAGAESGVNVATTGAQYVTIGTGIKGKLDETGAVPTTMNNLIVGVPMSTTIESESFIPSSPDYKIVYMDTDGKVLSTGKISTGVVVEIQDNNSNVIAKYTIVSYGDINGDAVLDVLDLSAGKLLSLGKDVPNITEAAKEAARVISDGQHTVDDYSAIVNNTLKGTQVDKGRKAPIELCDFSAVEPLTYTGAEQKPAITITTKDGVKVDSKNYNITYSNNINAGEMTATATITGINDYFGTKTISFTINKAAIDDTIGFTSVVLPSTVSDKSAKITGVKDFLKFVTIKYNGSTTVPTAPGIYKVTADIKADSNYLFTPGTRTLGFIVVAPKTATGYKVTTDDTLKTVTINVTNAVTDFKGFNNSIANWYNASYNLTVGGTLVNNGTEIPAALKPQAAMKKHKIVYKEFKNPKPLGKPPMLSHACWDLEERANVLGCYLPDINTLWNNSEATKKTSVVVADNEKTFTFELVFKQDTATINSKKNADFVSMCGYGRGGRKEDPLTYAGVPGYIWKEETTKKAFVFSRLQNNAETGVPEKTITVDFGNGKSYPGMTEAFQGTGLKTTVLGPNSAVCFVSAPTKSELNKKNIDINDVNEKQTVRLYDKTAKNRKYVTYSGFEIGLNSTKFMGLVDNVLGGMNMNVNGGTKLETLIGKSGWCKYACQDNSTGLCYNHEYFLTFSNVSESDRHYSINVNEVAGCDIRTNPAHKDYVTTDSYVPTITTGWMTAGEGFTVTLDSASIQNGYKLQVTDANGNPVPFNTEYGCYIMPKSNVTVTAVK